MSSGGGRSTKVEVRRMYVRHVGTTMSVFLGAKSKEDPRPRSVLHRLVQTVHVIGEPQTGALLSEAAGRNYVSPAAQHEWFGPSTS